MPEGGTFRGVGVALIVAGGLLVALGLALVFAERLPWLGRLPGDIVIRRERWVIYVPLATMVLVSLVLTLLLNLLSRRR
jgi:hypothetical protein